MVSTVIGNGTFGSSTGPALQSMSNGPQGGMRVDPNGSGDIYYADFNRIYVLRAATGNVSLLAGRTNHGYADGPAATASFGYRIQGLAVASNGAREPL